MATYDIETKLDDALTQLAQGAPRESVTREVPDAADLVSVAEHLQILAPAPEPRLADGRRRFLNEAERLTMLRAAPGLRVWQTAPRTAFTFAVAVALVLIVGSAMMIATMSGVTGGSSTPVQQATLSPTSAPKFTATPKSALAPNYAAPANAIDAVHTLVPAPAPTPMPARAKNFLMTRNDAVLVQCWMS